MSNKYVKLLRVHLICFQTYIFLFWIVRDFKKTFLAKI